MASGLSKRILFLSFVALTIVSVLILLFTYTFEDNDNYKPVFFERDAKRFTILLWTPFFSERDYIPATSLENCKHQNCVFTSERNHYDSADAVIFHLRDVRTDDLPKYRPSSLQRWVLLNHESPVHSPREELAALNGLINWTATYRQESEIFLSPRVTKLDQRSIVDNNINHNRSGYVVQLVSNCNTPGNREKFVTELRKHIDVDIYGRCGDKQCLPKMSTECYHNLSSKYFFYLSFENSICRDYVTEKFFSILDYPIVPVVFGGADYDKLAPPHSYIDALAAGNPKKLAEKLKKLIEHPEEYDKYFEWKNNYAMRMQSHPCQLCNLLNEPTEESKSWTNLIEWWFDQASCSSWKASH
ncbi:alpha-(1,3)-fucosyltransferase C-like [Brevipalpus obovatus]|uniref:alpha-(1,3)-fucosyltransferase C-like n=1 Tax=Brevipalpus obovatus TaxID=246614 RepID=UPI003D9E543C